MNLDGLGYRDATIVMTGASSGMGDAAARILGDMGAKLHIVDIQEPGAPCEAWYPTDLSKPDEVRAAVEKLKGIGPIHTIFACAGVPHTQGPLQVMLTNYVGTRQLLDALIPHMKDGGGIGIISSDAGMAWQHNLAANLEFLAIDDPEEARRHCEDRPQFLKDGYSTSKEMLIVWSKHHGITLAEQRRIRVNCIAPCPTDTAFMPPTIADVGQEFFDRWPYPLLGRMARAEEQAWPLILLTSPLNAVVTGALLFTDQGYAGGVFTGAIQPPTGASGSSGTTEAA